jgi:hypothetical protein
MARSGAQYFRILLGRPSSHVAWTLEGILDQFLDEVAETIAEPWPAVSPGPMPMTFVELRDDRLVAGYGDPADPVLTVLSVALHDLR